MVFYAYAVLCSELFLMTFYGALYRSKDSNLTPRIPVPSSKHDFLLISSYGRKLAELEKADATVAYTPRLSNWINLFKLPFRLTSFVVNEDDGEINLYEDKVLKVTLDQVTTKVISYQVAGYNVISQWLKLHSHAYTRADFTNTDFVELVELLGKIERQIRLIRRIDEAVETLLKGKLFVCGG